MKNYLKFLTLIVLSINVLISSAQQNDTLEIQRNDKGIVNFARFSSNLNLKTQNDTLFLKSILKAKNEDSFRIISEITNKAGGTHKKFQQYYKGIKVEDAEYLIHSNNGIIETINGDFERVKITSVTPSINEQRALSNALKFVNAKKYKWEDNAYERFIKERTNNPDATYYPKGELVIAKDYLNGSNNFKLAWKFTISSSIPENEQWIFIDAVSGEVIGNTPLILLDGNTPGIAQTRYNNQNVGITCYSYSGGYKLYETRNTTPGHTATIHTWNSLSQSSLTSPPVIEFSNNNTNWIAGSWPAIGQNQVALDAHWGEEKILDYWSIVRKRNSLNNSGLGLLGYVHYYDPNRQDIWPNNAAWDGNNHVMLYGDGDGITFNPLTALDVVAHEMGHGINQYTSNLHSANRNQECDALNEGFSDIWGATIEHWAAPNKQMWLMGEEIFVPFTYNCIRDLQNPHDAQAAETPHPDTYHGTYWNYNGEPHYNSTVLSHWFYLLSQGGTGWNNGLTSHAPANNGYNWTVVPIGINDAARLAYITEAHYLNSSADYSVLRQQTITAAIDSFGVNSCQVISATNAWYAVGVGSQFQYSNVTISGPTVVCSSGGTFTVNNVPSGCTITWTKSNNLTLSSSYGNTAVFTPNAYNGSGWVQVTINSTACGTSVSVPQYPVWIGPPQNPTISASLKNWGSYWEIRYFATQIENVTYQWKIDGYIQPFYGPFCSYIPPACGGDPALISQDYNVEVSVINQCDTTTTCEIFRYACGYTPTITMIGYCGGGGLPEELMIENDISIIISPNPVTDNVKISIIKGTIRIGNSVYKNNSLTEIPTLNKTYKLRIINSSGFPVFASNLYDNSILISTNNFVNGVYIVEINDGTKTYSQQFMIKH